MKALRLPLMLAIFLSRAAGVVTAAALACPVAAGAAPLSDQYSVVYGARVRQEISAPSALALRIGRPDSIEALVDRLLRVAEEYVGLPGELPRPRITLIDEEELHRKACGGPCTVRAAYVPGEGLFIEREMRPDINALHQSILFHELVHHVQVAHGLYRVLGECSVWQAREEQAYALQNRFLGALGSSQRVIDPGLRCAPDAGAPATIDSPQTFDSSGG
jgi:hypothetical protein